MGQNGPSQNWPGQNCSGHNDPGHNDPGQNGPGQNGLLFGQMYHNCPGRVFRHISNSILSLSYQIFYFS